MIKNSVSIEGTVSFLNELLEYDSYVISALFSTRIMCNRYLADHKTVQVRQLGEDAFQVGMIGILNGLFGIDENGWGHIAADYDNGKIIRFRLLSYEDVKEYVGPQDDPGNHGC